MLNLEAKRNGRPIHRFLTGEHDIGFSFLLGQGGWTLKPGLSIKMGTQYFYYIIYKTNTYRCTQSLLFGNQNQLQD
jgi:hypothetical protein